VLPVYIEGSYHAWPVHRRWPRPARIAVHFGAPIVAADLLTAGSGGPAHERATRALREAMLRLIRDRQGSAA
jgi:long-chain acyl-CoA synthetase